MDPKLKQFFSKAGVSERELQDKDTRDFIYDFIDKHGGIEAALLEVDRKASSNNMFKSPQHLPPPEPFTQCAKTYPSRSQQTQCRSNTHQMRI